jgi:hypothetical protein
MSRHVFISHSSKDDAFVKDQKALEVERRRGGEGYQVIPLLLPGIEPSALALWFDEEPVAVRVEVKAGGRGEALPGLLAALGERLPDEASQARQKAVESYLAYRRDGGQKHDLRGATLRAGGRRRRAERDSELKQQLVSILGADIPPQVKALLAGVQAILDGERDPALAADPELGYDDAVELQLLLEGLNSG